MQGVQEETDYCEISPKVSMPITEKGQRYAVLNYWCPEQDSNLHALNEHYPLKVACLPIPPSGRKASAKVVTFLRNANYFSKTFVEMRLKTFFAILAPVS